MSGLDRLLNASVDAVKKSGALENNAFMATVSVVNAGGTVDVTRAGDTFPSVRVLSGYQVPAVGDNVELLRSAGGWVCVGKLMTSSLPRIQSGSAQTPGSGGTAGTWTAVTVTFPKAFASTPNVVATPNSSVSAGTTELNWSVASVTTTGFELRSRRTTDSVTTFLWIATDF
ncbi:H-type lectin domain-containing protein [Streptomyces sp. NPDC058251]|uniref:H-type lectin domain-containing protein n=1 Tax=Streptomyces sp. NPDC058251 TaxID=3346404 RepID=UPI0036E59A8D